MGAFMRKPRELPSLFHHVRTWREEAVCNLEEASLEPSVASTLSSDFQPPEL